MDQINRAISNSVKNNQYFIESRSWYLRSFIYPIVERSYLGLIALIYIIILFYVFINILSLFPTSKQISVPIRLNDSLNRIAKIRKISRADLTPDYLIKEYLVKRYVTNRESYDFNTIENQLNVIKNSSSKYIFRKFYKYINIDNPESPMLYKRQISRNIEIKSIIFNPNDNNVIVKFVANDINNIDKSAIRSTWIASIYYQIQDIRDLAKSSDKQSLDFIVTEYKTEQIK